MAGASPAYSYYPERQPERPSKPRISVVPGRRQRAREQAAPSTFSIVARAAVAILVVLVVAGFAKITLSAATVTASLQAQDVSGKISDARSLGSDLEVAQSSLSNPTRVKTAAGKLGMGASDSTAVIDLGVDVVATDEQGNLSLTKSMAIAAGAQE